jgi:hypothetical protein
MEAESSSDALLTEEKERERLQQNDRNGNGEDAQEIAQQKTADERRCECPKGAVCVCPFIPPSPLATGTTVLLLHHPNEEKYLSWCLFLFYIC